MREILLIRINSGVLGGIERQVLHVARELAAAELFRPVLLTSSDDAPLAQAFRRAGFPAYSAPMDKGRLTEAAGCVERLLGKHDIALLQSHMFRESLIGRKVRRRHPELPHVLRAHVYIDFSPNPAWRKLGYHLLDKATSRGVDCYLANGRIIRDELLGRSRISPAKVHLLYDGVRQPGAPDPPGDAPGGAPFPARVAMVANLLPRKGHDVLLAGLELLNQRGLRVKARLIGAAAEGPQGAAFAERVRVEARRRGLAEQVEFYGYANDLHQALQGYHVLVLPSDSEGTPNCLLEGMSLRKLVVASAVGGVPEIVQEGKTGLLHAPQDPTAFADCLERIFTAPAGDWEMLRDAALASWKENFSVAQMTENLAAVYRELNVTF